MIEPAEDDYRLAPQNLEIEQALLGALLVNNKAVDRVISIVSQDDFYEEVHGRIYEAIITLVQAGKSADPVKLKPYFANDEGLKDVGGAGYLVRLAASAATIINATDYAMTISDLSIRRQIIDISEKMSDTAYDSPIDQPAQTQIEDAETALRELATGDTNQSSAMLIGDIMESAIDSIDKSHIDGVQPGLTTGLADLDNRIGGLHPTDLIIIGGRPGMCKTTLGLNIARGAAESLSNFDGKHDGVVGFYSLEMSSDQLGTRMITDLCFDSGIQYSHARTLKLSADERSIMRQNVAAYRSMPLVVEDKVPMTLTHLTSSCRRMASLWAARGQPLKLLVIDYLQLIMPPRGETNQVAHISQCSRGLKMLAKELCIPVVVLSQLSRAVEQRNDKRPMLSDLRDSGTIEQDADMVLFCYRDEEYLDRDRPDKGSSKYVDWQQKMHDAKNVIEVGIGKQRHGPTGLLRLGCFAGYGSIRDRAQGELL